MFNLFKMFKILLFVDDVDNYYEDDSEISISISELTYPKLDI